MKKHPDFSMLTAITHVLAESILVFRFLEDKHTVSCRVAMTNARQAMHITRKKSHSNSYFAIIEQKLVALSQLFPPPPQKKKKQKKTKKQTNKQKIIIIIK